MANRQRKNRTKNTRKKPRSNSSELKLQQIEDLLGEDFSSLSEAKKALKAQIGPSPKKKSYTVKELSTRRNKNISQFLNDLDQNKGNIDDLKKPSEYWAFGIKNDNGKTYHSYQLFSNIDYLVRKLGTYKGLQEESTKLLGNISVIRVKGVDADKYHAMKKAEVHRTWEERKKKHRTNQKRQREQQKKLKRSLAQEKMLKKRIAEQERKIAELQKKLNAKK